MKKGSYTYGHKVLFIIVSIFLIVLMFGYFRGMYYNIQTDTLLCTDETEQFLLISEAIFSENCLAYSDGERVYPGTIDYSKFTEDNLATCFTNLDQRYSITLNDITIGDELYSPVTITKPIQLYQNGETTFTTIKFQVEEVTC